MSSVYSSGTYTTVGPAPTGNSTINALIAGTKWGASGLGGSANVTFSFPVSFTVGSSGAQSSGAFGYSGEPDDSGQALNAVQISAVRDAMHKWSRVATLNCSEVVG